MSYVGTSPQIGDFIKADSISSGFNGVLKEFSILKASQPVPIASAVQLIVVKNGLILDPLVDYTIGSANYKILFTTAPLITDNISIRVLGSVFNFPSVAQGGVVTDSLAAKSVTTSKIADGAINTLQLGTGVVTETNVATNAISTSKLQDNSVTTPKILDGAISYLKMATAAIASVNDIVGSVANKIVTAANFKSGLRGLESYTFLGERVASNSATLDFTSLLTSEFDTYEFDFSSLKSSTGISNTLVMYVSTTNGTTWITTGGLYARAGNSNSNVSGTTASININGANSMVIADIDSTATRYRLNGKLRLESPLDTSAAKTLDYKVNTVTSSGFYSVVGAGLIDTTTPINAVRFQMNNGNLVSGTIRIYGIRKS